MRCAFGCLSGFLNSDMNDHIDIFSLRREGQRNTRRKAQCGNQGKT